MSDWVDLVSESPERAWHALRHDVQLVPVPVIVRETPDHPPADGEIERYLQSHHPELEAFRTRLRERDIRTLLEAMYLDHLRRFHLPDVRSSMDIDWIRKNLVEQTRELLGEALVEDGRRVYQLVGSAVKQTLDVPADKVARLRGPYDTPQCHAILTRPYVQQLMLAWVRSRLIGSGHCPALAAAFPADSRGPIDPLEALDAEEW